MSFTEVGRLLRSGGQDLAIKAGVVPSKRCDTVEAGAIKAE